MTSTQGKKMAILQQPSATPLSNFIWGEERLRRRVEILETLQTNPIFSKDVNVRGLSRKDVWAFRVQQAKELIDVWFQKGWSRQHFLEAGRMIADHMPCYGQFRIFIRNLEAQMSPEQRAYWVPLAERFEITGSYAQTELGHGSNLRGIETRATFDPDTDEFVLESPTVSSSKIWIGALGCWSTHAIVVAKLIIKGKDYGNHLFLVQIRDLKTHAVVPNIEILDQGEKALAAIPGVDNGIMRLFGKRIPRSQMFAGASWVSRDGTYHPAKNRNHSYTSMIIMRGMLSDELGVEMAKALYIASRYVQFRRQFGSGSAGEQETRVIDYASVKHRLFPAIAQAVAMMLNGREVDRKTSGSLPSNMESLHLETVGAKLYASEHASRGIEVARLVCGGHGTLGSAGLGEMYAFISPSRTYEGDSYVISLQVGRAIVKHWNNGTADQYPALSYLRRAQDQSLFNSKLSMSSPRQWLEPATQEGVLEQRAALLAHRHIEDSAQQKDTSFDVFELAMAHSDLAIWRAFQSQMSQAPERGMEALQALFNVFSLTTIMDGVHTFIGSSFMNDKNVKSLRTARDEAVEAFVPHLDTILNAYSFTDYETDSTLCRSDLTPYEAIVETARCNDLNDYRFIQPTLVSIRSIWKKYERARL